MTTNQIILLVVALLVVLVLVVVGWFYLRRQSLRRRFGPEYDRVVAEHNGTLAGEQELRDRQRRHAELTLKELSPDTRAWYAEQWQGLQSRFIDTPEDVVGAADELVTRLVAERGYPVKDYEEQLAHLSVEHAATLGDYRTAHDIAGRHSRGAATTEELRQAVVKYRSLVTELLGGDPAEMPITTAPTSEEAPDASGRRSTA
jgi:hypothetical protein